jgi:hypothetical protein
LFIYLTLTGIDHNAIVRPDINFLPIKLLPRILTSSSNTTRLAATSDKVYQLLAHGRWFSLGTPASSTTKTGHHDIAEILLKVAFNTKNQNQIKYQLLPQMLNSYNKHDRWYRGSKLVQWEEVDIW